MSLASRIKEAREKMGLTLDQLAKLTQVSKTYLWELEQDKEGTKKPSADVLLKIANPLNVSIGWLLGKPTLKVNTANVDITPSLLEFRDRMKGQGTVISDEELLDLASINFRGGQPQNANDWMSIYFILDRNAKGKTDG